jgi:hypothetical protein
MQSGSTSRRRLGLLAAAGLLVATNASAEFNENWTAVLAKGSAAGLAAGLDGTSFVAVSHNNGSSLYGIDADGSRSWRTKSKETFGGAATSADGLSVIVAGNTNSGKFLVASFSAASGKQEWSQTYVPANGFKAREAGVVSVSAKDGAIYAAGTISKAGVCCAYVVSRLETDGTLVWSHRTGNAAADQASVAAIAADPKGKGVFLSGNGTLDGAAAPFVARYGSRDGDERWRTFFATSAAPALTVSQSGKKIYIFAKKLDANYFQIGLVTHKGKVKFFRPLLLDGNAGSRGSIALTDKDKSLLMVASVTDNSLNESGFLMKTNTKTSGPTLVLSAETDAALGTWYRLVTSTPSGDLLVLSNVFNQDTRANEAPSVISYRE